MKLPTIEDLAAAHPGFLEEILSQSEAAAAIDRSEFTLQDWRNRGLGPAYLKYGRRVGYRRRDLYEWISANTVHPGRENGDGVA